MNNAKVFDPSTLLYSRMGCVLGLCQSEAVAEISQISFFILVGE